jgi:hypothetical protein
MLLCLLHCAVCVQPAPPGQCEGRSRCSRARHLLHRHIAQHIPGGSIQGRQVCLKRGLALDSMGIGHDVCEWVGGQHLLCLPPCRHGVAASSHTPPPLTYASVTCEHTTRSSFIHSFIHSFILEWQKVCGASDRFTQQAALCSPQR